MRSSPHQRSGRGSPSGPWRSRSRLTWSIPRRPGSRGPNRRIAVVGGGIGGLGGAGVLAAQSWERSGSYKHLTLAAGGLVEVSGVGGTCRKKN